MMREIFILLEELGVACKKYEHSSVFTNEESEKLGIGKAAENSKNLFLSDDKNERFYLLTIQHGKRADLRRLAELAGEKKLHFANETYLKKLLSLTPGSVTPLGLLYDKDLCVKYFIDKDLLKQDIIYVHPMINTATLGIKIADFKIIVAHSGHEINLY